MDKSQKQLMDQVDEQFKSMTRGGYEVPVALAIGNKKIGFSFADVTRALAVQDGIVSYIMYRMDGEDATISFTDAQIALDIFNNKLLGRDAFIKGKVKFTGDIELIIQMQSLFPRS